MLARWHATVCRSCCRAVRHVVPFLPSTPACRRRPAAIIDRFLRQFEGPNRGPVNVAPPARPPASLSVGGARWATPSSGMSLGATWLCTEAQDASRRARSASERAENRREVMGVFGDGLDLRWQSSQKAKIVGDGGHSANTQTSATRVGTRAHRSVPLGGNCANHGSALHDEGDGDGGQI